MKKLFFFFAITIIYSASAQNGTDALRYSLLQQGGGTARTMGVAGATGALGADFSSLSGNPAGLAAYRTSEFMITPGYFTSTVRSKLQGDGNLAQNERNAKFHLNNIGVVFANRPSKQNWTTSNLAFGLNRLANFNNSFYYEGKSEGSIVNRFQEKANSTNELNPYEDSLAMETGAIFYKNLGDTFYSTDLDKNDVVNRTQEGNISGRINELTMGYAANYKDKLLIGGSIGIPFVSYNEAKTYSESNPKNIDGTISGTLPYFKSLVYQENLSQSGAGINVKLGLIFIPTQNLRIGLSGQTPTLYTLTDVYTTNLTYSYVDKKNVLQSTKANSPDGSFEYKLRTPQRLTGSVAYLFGKKGFISADVDVVDYSTMNFQFDKDKSLQNQVNQGITNIYQQTFNVRLGAEYVMDIFRFRAGVSTLGLPTKGFDNRSYLNTASKLYSAGIGIRENRFYADLGYQVTQSNTIGQPYLVSNDYAQVKFDRRITNSQLVLTVGFKF